MIYGRYFQTCEKNRNNVTTTFKLKEEDIKTMVNDMSVSPKILYRENCEYIEGFNGIIIEEPSSNVISDFGDNLTIKRRRPVLICQN